MQIKDSGTVPRNLVSELLANDVRLGLLLVAVARFARRVGNSVEADLAYRRIEALYSNVERLIGEEFTVEEKPSLFDDLRSLRIAIDGLPQPDPEQRNGTDGMKLKSRAQSANPNV